MIARQSKPAKSISHLIAQICAAITAAISFLAIAGWVLDRPLLASWGQGWIPMAPSSALSFLLLGTAVLWNARAPASLAARSAGLAIGSAVALVAAMLSILSPQEIRLDAEHLGFSVAVTVEGSPIGHMSPATAFCFLVGGLSLVALLCSTPDRRWPALAALLLVGPLLFASAIFLLAYRVGLPLFYGGAFIPPALPSSIALAALGAALLALDWSRHWTFDQPPLDSATRRRSHAFALVFVVIVVCLTAAGGIFFRNTMAEKRNETERLLSAIADLKVGDLVRWRLERIGDATLIHESTLFADLVRRALEVPPDAQAQAQIHAWLGITRKAYGYSKVSLIDARGIERVSIPAAPLAASELEKSRLALRGGKLGMGDIERHESGGEPYLALQVPIVDHATSGRPLGVVRLEIDPRIYLYPLIERWPAPSRTAETLLVRRDGDDALFLNGLRFEKNAALRFRIPLTRTDAPAVMAVLGQEGTVEGTDYRGLPSIAALRAVPATPWFLVARISTEEAFGSLTETLALAAGVLATLLTSAAVVMGFIWREQVAVSRSERSRINELAASSQETARQNEALQREIGTRKRVEDELRIAKQAAEDGLQEERMLLSAIVDSTEDAIIAKSLDGIVASWNKSATKLFGYSAEEMIGQPIIKLIPPECQSDEGEVLAAIARGEAIHHFDTERICKDGRRINVSVSVAPIRDKNGRITGASKIARDITERKRVEEQLRRLSETLEARIEERTAQLQRSNRELEQFAYVASHDLQEPLRMVVGFVQLLEKRLAGKLDADTREFIGYAVDGAMRMQGLIEDILAYSRVTTQAQPFASVDSGEALKEALHRLAIRIAETGAEVHAQSLPVVMADHAQVVQLLQNLIGNALKFCKDRAPNVLVEAVHEAKRWRFSVTDNGIGIAPEYRGQLFVIFKRLHTRREYPGSGIGLAICKRIVERHGGDIGIDSAPAGGTVIWFTLPEEKSP